MNQHLQNIVNIIEQVESLPAEQKDAILKSLKDAGKEIDITAFKLDRTEKVKRTTAILLEETIEELEQKRKAVEAQNRELEIEASLERVRTIAMGMSMPGDLLNISKANYVELTKLGFSEIRNSLIGIFHDDKNYFTDYDYSDFSGGSITNIPYNKNSLIDKSVQQMKSATDAFTEFIVEGTELEEWKAFRKQNGEYDDTRLKDTNALYYYFYSIEQGNVGVSTFKKISEEQLNILKRFRNVFDLAYKRYTDITTAAAQAREAEIELALERVRARTMAMQHSDELADASLLLDSQVRMLGIKTRGCGFNIYGDKESTEWFSSEMGTMPTYKTPREGVFLRYYKEGQTGKSMYIETFTGEACAAHYKYLCTLPVLGDGLRKLTESGGSFPVQQIDHVTYFKYGYLLFITLEPAPDAHDIFIRFAKVFEQTYTRFLDLQKAEAQSRESQVQLALERVRARTMAMHHSVELAETASILFQQIKELGFETWSCGFCIWQKDDMAELWMGADSGGLLPPMLIPYQEERTHNDIYQALQQNKSSHHRIWEGKELEEHYAFLKTIPSVKAAIDQLTEAGLTLPDKQCYYVGFFKQGYLLLITKETNEALENLSQRFATVFDLTYTRFLDLQKAEAQARESQVQLALERVRARTMAMQKSEELADTASLLFHQVKSLGIECYSSGFTVWENNDNELVSWMCNADGSVNPPFIMPAKENAWHLRQYLSWKRKEDFIIYDFSGTEMKDHYRYLRSFPLLDAAFKISEAAGVKTPPRQVHNIFNFTHGNLLFITLAPALESLEIFKRFAAVFDQTYTRFLDLQKAEAQAREAQVEAALEKVRSRTLAMQKSDELAETAAVLFQQLIALGIAPNRLYIAIVKDENGTSEFWITDEDGTKVSTAFSANLNDNLSFAKMFEGWKLQKKSLVITMQGHELQQYFNHLTSLGVPFKDGLTQKKRVQDIAYFSKGFIGIASPGDQPAETLQLLERFAAVFNLTFTRFNDLTIAEAHALRAEQDLIEIKNAKQKAEDTLEELKLTQKQLIQSEKMASLGELTAGIAHEIQNPLNFVNNFSEVSKELLEEMSEAFEKGDTAEAKEIMNDVIENLQKINHHGKRADGIVKGMLQHSRSSSGQKEPTDINALADEYLRLAYHGIRAKDKLFNATLKTDYDESIGNINIIPHDIGRVMLNLITNAFYAVNEKRIGQQARGNDYEPTVSIITGKTNGETDSHPVEIAICDNGDGIPENIIDKIFQPFFTTKPTGQGTGLGLSLAYDIVKAHGGQLLVETTKNEGTTFIIQLPTV